MSGNRTILLIFLALITSVDIYSQETVDQESGDQDKEDFISDFFIDLDPKIWGLEARLGLELFTLDPVVDTFIYLGLGLIYRTEYFTRNQQLELLVPDDIPSSTNYRDFTYYSNWIFRYMIGLYQGLVPRVNDAGEKEDRDLLSTYLLYRGWYDSPIINSSSGINFSQSNLIYLNSNYISSLIWGLEVLAKETDELSNLDDGIESNISVEWAPEALNQNSSEASFLRFTGQFKYFLPLYSNKSEFGNLFSLNLGVKLIGDYIIGLSPNQSYEGIPHSMSTRMGSFYPERGLGGTIRGYLSGRFDGKLKMASNFDLRFNLPYVFDPKLIPGAVIYFDAGYYADPPGSSRNEQGFVASLGIGINGQIVGFGSGSLYTHFVFPETALSGSFWVPITLSFGFQF